jgi:hypothetical protein
MAIITKHQAKAPPPPTKEQAKILCENGLGQLKGVGNPAEYMNEREAIHYLGTKGIPVGKTFFQNLRAKGRGPPVHYLGQRAFYRLAELDAWLPTIFRDKTWNRKPKVTATVQEARPSRPRSKVMTAAAE